MFNPDNNETQNSISNALMYWDQIQELFLEVIQTDSFTYRNAVDYFDVKSDSFVNFLETISEKYSWFDYRMTPHIVEFLNVLIDDTFTQKPNDDENYDCWYSDLEQNIRLTHQIELVDLLQKVRYRINVEHFYEKHKTPEQAVYLIGIYYLEEIEELKKNKTF